MLFSFDLAGSIGNAAYYILFAVGLLLIIKGADWFIDSTIWFAKVFRIPHIIIGATIVSICTTLPETIVSVTGSVMAIEGVAFGNAVGSIAFNTGIILGILFLFASPEIKEKKEFLNKGTLLIALLILTWLVGLFYGFIGKFMGVVLILVLITYLAQNVLSVMKKSRVESAHEKREAIVATPTKIFRNIISFAVGCAFVVGGSSMLVTNGQEIALMIGVPTTAVAFIFMAVGTSLPELVTAVTSIKKGAHDVGVGNILGADLLNIIQVISISAIIRPISLQEAGMMLFQIPMTLAIVGAALLFGIVNKRRFKAWNGLVLIALYAVFLVITMFFTNIPTVGPLFS